MANYSTLKATIAQYIKENHVNDISGNLLQQQLLAMVNSLGAGYQFAGVATQDTNPGTPDQNVFYLASEAGTYYNFSGIVVAENEVAILKWNGAWSKDSTGAATQESVNKLGQIAVVRSPGINLLDNKANGVLYGMALSSDGIISISSTYNVSDFIPVLPNTRYYRASDTEHQIRYSCCFDSDFNVISGGISSQASSFLTPENCAFVRVTLWATDWDKAQISTENIAYVPYNPIDGYLDGIKETIDGLNTTIINKTSDKVVVNSNNMFNPNDDDVKRGYYLSYNGQLHVAANYDVSGYIKVDDGITYYCATDAINGFRYICCFDANRQLMSDAITETGVRSFTVPAGVAFVRVTIFATDWGKAQVSKNSISYIPYNPISGYLTNENSNILFGKKWVACGDSFTHGDFSNSPTQDYTIESGKYAGQYKVYPYLIGNRNNMDIVNEAINGSTMTYIDGVQTYAFSLTRYQNIPSDADYITLKFGINDDASHKNAPIGTIDDTTNETFYGAYNIVLDYLIRNHPQAKIGVIITNGSTLDIVNATIAIAKKWGVPYLNEATDEQCSFMFRSNRSGVVSSIRNFRNEYWYVSNIDGARNSHPNAKAHEFESTVVENWLRSL